jgi:wyosine [tRNA(Phe)-imidazoG37] synthetase (radical SAM superfamily)
MNKNYIFGPVPSRRLGVSLGVDIVPYKTCSLNCVYCESGDTTLLTSERKEYIPTVEILKQLDEALQKKPKLDYLTFSGGGEPTLHSGIGEIIEHIKKNHPSYKICLLTNGTLLGDEKLIKELKNLDLAIPSLDFTNINELIKINRPVEGLSPQGILDGIIKFRKNSNCELWLEIFVAPGANDSEESINAFAEAVRQIGPDKVQLNTLDRPGCVDWIKAAPEETMMSFVEKLEPIAPIEAVGKFTYKSPAIEKKAQIKELEIQIIDIISRRPCTLEDIVFTTGIDKETVSQTLKTMEKKDKAQTETRDRGVFYKLK